MSVSNWVLSGIAGAVGVVALAWVVPQLTAPCCPPEGAFVPESEAAQAPNAARYATLQVDGMNCESCVGTLTSALQEVTGVASAKVVFEEKKAVVGYDPALVTPQAMLNVIAKLGYTAKLLEDRAGA